MKKEDIDLLLKIKAIRPRQIDKEKVLSILESINLTIKVAKSIGLNENSTIVIFREFYESIRQLGDAYWWISGYEPLNHEVSLDILRTVDITEKTKLNFLEHFKKIRNDVNYRGFKPTLSQTKDIISFWNECSGEIINLIKKKIV